MHNLVFCRSGGEKLLFQISPSLRNNRNFWQNSPKLFSSVFHFTCYIENEKIEEKAEVCKELEKLALSKRILNLPNLFI